jgi:hypothetical protein
MNRRFGDHEKRSHAVRACLERGQWEMRAMQRPFFQIGRDVSR